MGLNSIKMVELIQERNGVFRLSRAMVRYAPFDWDVFNEKRAQTLTDFLRKGREERSIGKGKNVTISMPGISVFVRYVDLLETKRKKLDELIHMEAKQQIPMDLDEVAWDYKIVSESGRRAKQAMLMAVKRDVVNETSDIVKKSGFVPKAVSISLLCLLDLAKNKRNCKNVAGIIIIDIGAESSGILINRKKHIWLRSFSIGGKQISASIAQNAGIDLDKAEAIKRQGISASEKIDAKDTLFIKETISQNLNTLVTEVERSISFYKMDQIGEDSDLDEERFKNFTVLVTGGGSKIDGLLELFTQRLGMQVSALKTFDGMKISRKALVKKQLDGLNHESDMTDEADPLLAVAVGAAIQGFGKDGGRINFLKKEIAVQKSFNASKLLRAASFMFFFSAFIVHFFLQNEEFKLYRKHLDELERVSENVDAYGPQLDAVRQKTTLLEEDGLFLMSFLHKRFLWLSLLDQIASALPDDVWLTNYQGSGRLSAETLDNNEVIVQGVTVSYDDLNAFMLALRECSLVKEVKPESIVGQDEFFNFLLKLEICDTPQKNPTVDNANRNA